MVDIPTTVGLIDFLCLVASVRISDGTSLPSSRESVSLPMKGRQSRYLQNGLEMVELTGVGVSGTGGDTATGIWYP
jgi:hypothetical protein